MLPLQAFSVGDVADIPKREWPFQDETEWDKGRLYRGYTVATQVCLACHSFQYVTHRDLTRAKFTLDEATYLAKQLEMPVNDTIISGLADDDAKELYGKAVPDLSLMNKARAGLADYTYALLMGYPDTEDPILKIKLQELFPDGFPEGAYYNTVYPGQAIAMPSPLVADDLVSYHDGTSATIDQMAQDVAYFMQWTAEPERFERHRLGVYVLLYLFIFTVLAWWVNKLVWRDIKAQKRATKKAPQ